jgi:hypothetical protein
MFKDLVSPTAGGVKVPVSRLHKDRGTMAGATLILRNTATNEQTLLTFGSAALRDAGHLSVADEAYGPNEIVEGVAFTMYYPGGLLKPVFIPRALVPANERVLSYVFDENQLSPAQRSEMLPTSNWLTNYSAIAFLNGSNPDNILYSRKCNYFLHELKNVNE